MEKSMVVFSGKPGPCIHISLVFNSVAQMRDVAVSASHNLPCMLRPTDHDVHVLDESDWVEQFQTDVGTLRHSYDPMEVEFFIEMVKVMEVWQNILNLNFTRYGLQATSTGYISQRQAASTSLALPTSGKQPNTGDPDDYNDFTLTMAREWYNQTPPSLAYDVEDARGHQFWPAFLHILF